MLSEVSCTLMPFTQERRSREPKRRERGGEEDIEIRIQRHRVMHLHDTYAYSLLGYILIGPVTIVNLRDITTQSDLMDENAVFAFDTHPRISSTAALGYRVQIQWSQLGMQFGSYNGTHTVYLPPEGPRNCWGTANTTLELVEAGSYKLTVPTAVFDSGPLFINMSVSLVCLQLTSNSCPLCSQWRYTGQASIDISAKRGM